MRYLGGKSRQSKVWAPLILSLTSERRVYLEPFVGGGWMFRRLAPAFQARLAGDANPDLMLLWQAVQTGWLPEDRPYSKEEWLALKAAEPSPLRSAVGYGCSVLKPFGVYGKPSMGALIANLKAMLPPLAGAALACTNYELWAPDEQTVVYADPPYAGVSGYDHGLDHKVFWATMDRWVKGGTEVFVSEYKAPDHWRCVSALDLPAVSFKKGSNKRQVDRLFTRVP